MSKGFIIYVNLCTLHTYVKMLALIYVSDQPYVSSQEMRRQLSFENTTMEHSVECNIRKGEQSDPLLR